MDADGRTKDVSASGTWFNTDGGKVGTQENVAGGETVTMWAMNKAGYQMDEKGTQKRALCITARV